MNIITIKDPNGNIVCSVENMNPIKSEETYNGISLGTVVDPKTVLPPKLYNLYNKYKGKSVDIEYIKNGKRESETEFVFEDELIYWFNNKMSSGEVDAEWTKELYYIGDTNDGEFLCYFKPLDRIIRLFHEDIYKYKNISESSRWKPNQCVDIEKEYYWSIAEFCSIVEQKKYIL